MPAVVHPTAQTTLGLLPSPTGWVDDLGSDFALRDCQVTDNRWRTPLSHAASRFDQALTNAASAGIKLRAWNHLDPATIQAYFDDHAWYMQPHFLDNPSSFFELPPGDVNVHEGRPLPRRSDPDSADRVMLEFYSPFETSDPDRRDQFATFYPNERVEARGWFHKDGPRPVIICLHGFSMPGYNANTFWFSARKMFDAGLDVVLFNLPLHGSRRPSFSRYHGTALIVPSFWRLNECAAQAVMDLRILVRHLRDRGAPSVGVTGYSWGGYHSALLAGIEPNIDYAIPVSSVVSIADVMMGWKFGAYVRRTVPDYGEVLRKMRRMIAVHAPISHQLQLPRENVMLVAAVGDRIAPPVHTELLWEHWGRPKLVWSRGAHVLYYDKSRILAQKLKFLKRLDIL